MMASHWTRQSAKPKAGRQARACVCLCACLKGLLTRVRSLISSKSIKRKSPPRQAVAVVEAVIHSKLKVHEPIREKIRLK